MAHVLRSVMDPRLADMLEVWRQGGHADPLTAFAAHRDHLLVIESGPEGDRYAHYGTAFAAQFGMDLTGRVIDTLPEDILPAARRGILAFEYETARRLGRPLWRCYSARFDDGSLQTWQRLVLPLGDGRLAVGAHAVTPPPGRDTSSAEGLLRLVAERVPVVLDEDGAVSDLALSLQAFGDAKLHAAELEQLASRDPLTGVSNLRHFNHVAGLELDHCRRMGRDFALLALDIDHFKRINDSWGHATGDAALKAFVAACSDALRTIDLLGRCGGEEFAVALPNTGADGALVIAERLRRQVEAVVLELPGGDGLRFTVSIGIAVAGCESTTIPALMARADEALYRSKREGRNRVSAAV